MKIIIALILLFNVIYAHPHTFIEVYPTITVENQKTKKINFLWKMDEMTSSMLIMEFDENGDGKIDEKENQFVFENYFSSLVDYNFYTDVTIKGKVQKFPEPKNFKVFIENNKICYSFDIDKKYDVKQTLFDFGDTDFFIAMILKKEFITIKGATPLVSDLDNDFYFGYRLELK